MALRKELIARLRNDFYLDWHGVHGSSHWARVKQNGLLLAQDTNAEFPNSYLKLPGGNSYSEEFPKTREVLYFKMCRESESAWKLQV